MLELFRKEFKKLGIKDICDLAIKTIGGNDYIVYSTTTVTEAMAGAALVDYEFMGYKVIYLGINANPALVDEILAHEAMHHIRGDRTPKEIISLKQLATAYYEEEQAINIQVAPTMYRDTERLWETNKLAFIINGIMGVYQNNQELIDELISESNHSEFLVGFINGMRNQLTA